MLPCDVTVITAWWNTPELARDYWVAMLTADANVLVIDNGSRPPLPNAIRLEENTGFSRANNHGLSLARTPAVLFVNNDVVATSSDWLERLAAAIEPGVLVGAQLRNDPHADVDGHRFPYLDGWCVGGMRDELLELGGWDESLEEPSYWGDNLLSLRARAAGMTLKEVRVGLRHLVNGTPSPNRDVAGAANRQRYVAEVRDLIGVAA